MRADKINDAEFSESIDAPAPWQLQGSAYICVLNCPPDLLENESFVSDSLRGRRQNNSPVLMMFVDYISSPVGPYHEILFIPGFFKFEDDTKHFSISRIFVSSQDSVINGRRNWGIPKELAQFEVEYANNDVDHVVVKREGKPAVELSFRSWPLPMPFTTAILPKSLITLRQHYDDVSFTFNPKARGWLRPARLTEIQVNSAEFPPIQLEHVKFVFKVTRFQMCFPEAIIKDL